MAFSAIASVKSFALMDTNASRACVSTSIPVSAVIAGGTVAVNMGGISVPVEQTLSDLSMSLTETDDPNKVKVVITTSSGRTIECEANIDGYDATVPTFKLESISMPFEYNGMTLELELDITISDVAANYSLNEINGIGKATGTSKIELFGQSIDADMDIDLDIYFKNAGE